MARNSIVGTTGPEKLVGTGARDKIEGLKGADELLGKGGKDTLKGGNGQDTLDGGAGSDKLDGGKGNDWLEISQGADTIDGGQGFDWLDASGWDGGIYWNLLNFAVTDFGTGVQIPAGTLLLGASGDSANWTQQSITGIENLKGSDARDYITSLADFGTVRLGKGDDSFDASSATLVQGGGGSDRISIASGRAEGGNGADVLSGGRATEGAELIGGKGNDVILVSGPSVARGGSGQDTITYLDGNTNKMVFGGGGADVFEFNSIGSGSGAIQDFEPGKDKIDISGYTSRNGEGWNELVTMFEAGDGGIALRLDLQSFSNQTFTFIGLEFSDLSESDFILV